MSEVGSVRTYGHWVRPQLTGLFGLSIAANAVLGVGALVAIVAALLQGVVGALVAIAATALLTAPLVIRTRDKRTLYELLWLRGSKHRAVRTGRAVLVQGPAGMVADGKCRLPGLLAQSELFEVDNGVYQAPFGLLYVPRTGHYTVVIECAAAGLDMVDTPVLDAQVANWGVFLAMLGQQNSDVVGAQVVIETAPDTGVRFRRELDVLRAPRASGHALRVVEQVKQTYPAGSAQIGTRVTLTFSDRAFDGASTRRDRETMATRIANGMPGFIAQLKVSGAGSMPTPLPAADITDLTRVAYDPHVAQDVDEARGEGGTGLSWADAGPAFADDRDPVVYRHDRAFSLCWQMVGAPESVVQAGVLRQLLAPHVDVARKRVTLLYRPMSNEAAARVADGGLTNATFVMNNNKRARARDEMRLVHARKTASEEASGAGMVRFGAVVTATVLNANQIPKAAEAVKQLRAPARLKLRPATSVQATTFAAGLPLGLVLPDHMALPLPTGWKDAL